VGPLEPDPLMRSTGILLSNHGHFITCTDSAGPCATGPALSTLLPDAADSARRMRAAVKQWGGWPISKFMRWMTLCLSAPVSRRHPRCPKRRRNARNAEPPVRRSRADRFRRRRADQPNAGRDQHRVRSVKGTPRQHRRACTCCIIWTCATRTRSLDCRITSGSCAPMQWILRPWQPRCPVLSIPPCGPAKLARKCST